MNADAERPKFATSQKIYALLLRAYPRRHRTEYGAAMMQLFRDQCRDAWNEDQKWGMTKLWLRLVPDLINSSIWERLAALKERKTMNDNLAGLSTNRNSPAAVFMAAFVTVFLITTILATAVTFVLPETYASTCRIKMEPDASATSMNSNAAVYDPYFIQTEFEVMQSELVLSNVIATLNLNVQWGKKYFAGETLKSAETMKILRGRLWLRPVKNTKLISITVFSDDKNEAALIANALAESYRTFRMTKYHADHPDLDVRISIPNFVQITDPAEPGRFPVRPNKTLNIVVGMCAGIVLGCVAGALAVWVSTNRAKRRVVV